MINHYTELYKIVPLICVVPNSATSLLTWVTLSAKYFSVIYQCSDFSLSLSFCSSRGRIYTIVYFYLWQSPVLCQSIPQGFQDFPTCFSSYLQENSEKFVPPRGSISVQNVDDLLVSQKLESIAKLIFWLCYSSLLHRT